MKKALITGITGQDGSYLAEGGRVRWVTESQSRVVSHESGVYGGKRARPGSKNDDEQERSGTRPHPASKHVQCGADRSHLSGSELCQYELVLSVPGAILEVD